MKPDLQKKLLQYSALALAGLAVSHNADGQIIYTDVNPDVELYNDSFALDLNNDGIVDFKLVNIDELIISTVSGTYAGTEWIYATNEVTVYSNNKVLDADVTLLPASLQAGDSIKISGNWNSGGYLNRAYYWRDWWMGSSTNESNMLNSSEGLWQKDSTRFLGLEIEVNGEHYLGWARLEIMGDNIFDTLIIKSYAFNSIPNEGLLAGEIDIANSSNQPTTNTDFDVHQTTSQLQVTFQDASAFLGKQIQLINIEGAVVYESEITSAQLSIATSNLPTGMFLLKVDGAKGVEVRKVFVKN